MSYISVVIFNTYTLSCLQQIKRTALLTQYTRGHRKAHIYWQYHETHIFHNFFSLSLLCIYRKLITVGCCNSLLQGCEKNNQLFTLSNKQINNITNTAQKGDESTSLSTSLRDYSVTCLGEISRETFTITVDNVMNTTS